MDGDLLSVVLERADKDDSLPEPAKLLVLAALQGDDDLADALDRSRPAGPVPEPSAPTTAVRAFLSSISVEGFRGIGPKAVLRLNPAPGLTVIAGRNGCGKSSFAEALEVALTSGSYRWQTRKGAVWAEAWRNLHHGAAASIEIELAEEGHGPTTVAATWGEDTELAAPRSWVQRRGAKRQPGLSRARLGKRP